MKILFVMGVLTLALHAGCSTTHFQTPDYYETKAITNSYPVGVEVSVEELNCQKNKQRCDVQAKSDWKTHRKYTKNYYFE